MVDDGIISFDATDAVHNSNIPLVANTKKRAEFIASILVEDDLSVFRKYQVITVQESTLTSVSKQPNRKLKSPTTNANDVQTDLDNYLYGDLDEDDDEKKDDKVAPHDRNQTMETEEYEVRIRSAIITKIADRAIESGDVSWATVLGKLMLSGVQHYESHDESKEGSSSTNRPLASLKHAEPLAELYLLRHTPTLLLRAATFQNMRYRHTKDIDDLRSLLSNKYYIQNRFDLQGPHNAIISHLLNFRDLIAFKSNVERSKQNDNKEYLSLHEFLVSTLHSHLETTLINTGYKLQRSASNDNSDEQTKDDEGGAAITIFNYANIVAICLEVGRSLHHLGLCLGRRQRDHAKSADIPSPVTPWENNSDDKMTVALEIDCYRKALEAYKACMYIFSKAEKNTQSGSSQARGKQDELLQLREAKISVELHLADTLTCVGEYCHLLL
jgi:hypothetical protein